LSWVKRSNRITTPPIAASVQRCSSTAGFGSVNSAQNRDLRGTLRAARDLVGPDAEALERARAESGGDRDVGVAPACDQDAPGAGLVVAWIEGVPGAAQVRLEPAGEVHRRVRRGQADVAEVARAVAGGDVQAAAERDRKMRVVAADALAIVEHVPRRLGRARVFVAEGDVLVDEVADRLHARPAEGRP